MHYIVDMAEVSKNQFLRYKEKALDPSKITSHPMPCLIFWDINAEAEDQFPELVSLAQNDNPFVFHDWYVSTWEKEGEDYYTIGPKDRERFDPTLLIDLDKYGNTFYIIKKI